jgi:hypothetical protein
MCDWTVSLRERDEEEEEEKEPRIVCLFVCRDLSHALCGENIPAKMGR